MRFLFFGFSLPVLLVALVLIWTTTSSTAFPRLPKTAFTHLGRSRTTKTSTTAVYFFGGPKDDGSPGDYVCLVRTNSKRKVCALLLPRKRMQDCRIRMRLCYRQAVVAQRPILIGSLLFVSIACTTCTFSPNQCFPLNAAQFYFGKPNACHCVDTMHGLSITIVIPSPIDDRIAATSLRRVPKRGRLSRTTGPVLRVVPSSGASKKYPKGPPLLRRARLHPSTKRANSGHY